MIKIVQATALFLAALVTVISHLDRCLNGPGDHDSAENRG